jgi:hypothetical protein
LTGDVGRGCGDASRALLFLFFEAIGLFPIRQPAAQAGNNRVSGRSQTIRSKYHQNCPRRPAESAVCE